MPRYLNAPDDRIEITYLAPVAPRAFRANCDVDGRCAHIGEGPLLHSLTSRGAVGVQLPHGLSTDVAQHPLLYRNARMPTAASYSPSGLYGCTGDPTSLGRMKQLHYSFYLHTLVGVVLLRWKP